MRKVFFILPFLVLILFCTANLLAQVEIKVDTIKTTKTRTLRIITTRTAPKFILQLSGGWNFGAMELSGHNGGFSSYDFRSGKSFCARNGFGVNLSAKYPLGKEAHFWLVALAGFNRFQSNLVASNDDEGKIAYNALSGGLGLDYNFTPTHRVKYFFGANALFSIINGKATIRDNVLQTNTEVKIKWSSRIGYSAYMGLEYSIENNFGLNCGVRFTHANLLLKESQEPVNNEITLNDKSLNTGSQITYSGWKQFAYVTTYAGVSIYFRVKERKYKLP
jgi:opacity protein-like surface antigen